MTPKNTLNAKNLEALGVERLAELLIEISTGNATAKRLLRIPMFGFIAVHDRYDQEQSLCAGRIWQRAHLLATSRGLAARPANEAVEMVDHERRLGHQPQYAGLLAQLMGDEAWQPTFTFCMGHAIRPAPASPRRPYRDVVL